MVLLNAAMKKTTVPGSFYFSLIFIGVDTWQPWSVFQNLDTLQSEIIREFQHKNHFISSY